MPELEYIVMPSPESEKPGGRPKNRVDKSGLRTTALILGGLILLAGAGYLTYWQFFKTKGDGAGSKNAIPKIIVDDVSKKTDMDNDGLTDDREKEIGTSPSNPDTDKDGLADGDEVNIYFSDPLLPDTDSDSFDDGKEVAGNYSPVINTGEKASSEEVQRWTDKISQFGLHEPTKTTLKLKSIRAEEEKKISTYTNSVYDYSIEIPQVLATRESDSGRKVGIYIAGVTPEDQEVLNDPISINLAIKLPEQTLDEWIANQYKAGEDYQQKQEREINSIKAIELTGMTGEDCPANRTFFPKNGVIIVLTWTCTDISPFGEFYNQIVSSFKWTS